MSRYCIDNGAMIAQAGVFAHQHGFSTAIADSSCTQRCVYLFTHSLTRSLITYLLTDMFRFRTDQVEVIWRPAAVSVTKEGYA